MSAASTQPNLTTVSRCISVSTALVKFLPEFVVLLIGALGTARSVHGTARSMTTVKKMTLQSVYSLLPTIRAMNAFMMAH
jgi:hypothetical protein